MKKVLLVLLLLACLLPLVACSGASMTDFASAEKTYSTPPAAEMLTAAPMADEVYELYEYDGPSEPAFTDAESGGGYGGAGSLPAGAEARKVVTSAEFRISTDDFGGAMRRLEQKIAISGGYIQQSENRAATAGRAAYASMTIRVPAALYGDFKTFLTDLAELDSASEHGDDVTVQYYDTEARLKVLQAQEERIKTFIANSKDLDEIFKIERELTRISTEIEQLTTVKNRLDNLTAYATVYVEIWETTEPEPVEPVGFGEKVNNALKGSINGIIIALQALLLLLIWCWPLLALAAIVLLLVRLFSKRRAQARGKKSPPPAEEVKKNE